MESKGRGQGDKESGIVQLGQYQESDTEFIGKVGDLLNPTISRERAGSESFERRIHTPPAPGGGSGPRGRFE
jgi:hypothetical protein